jgi:tRNA threonylcarbamoyladenosine biosynthesis protein TsaE
MTRSSTYPRAGTNTASTSSLEMSATFVFNSTSESDTDRFGALIARALPPGTVVALIGTLGAGKTRLVQAVGKAVGLDSHEVVSPTFVLVHEYQIPPSADRQIPVASIYHFDAYRIRDNDEFLALGPDEYFADGHAWTFIEWADRIAPCLPSEHLRIDSEVTGPISRRFVVTPIGSAPEEISRQLSASPSASLNPEP